MTRRRISCHQSSQPKQIQWGTEEKQENKYQNINNTIKKRKRNKYYSSCTVCHVHAFLHAFFAHFWIWTIRGFVRALHCMNKSKRWHTKRWNWTKQQSFEKAQRTHFTPDRAWGSEPYHLSFISSGLLLWVCAGCLWCVCFAYIAYCLCVCMCVCVCVYVTVYHFCVYVLRVVTRVCVCVYVL